MSGTVIVIRDIEMNKNKVLFLFFGAYMQVEVMNGQIINK